MKLYKRKRNDPAPLAQADPYMIKAGNGRYYVYASGGQLFSSDGLFEGWRYDGVCLDMPGQKECWAPCVIETDGVYYMYYSSEDDGANSQHEQSIRLAVSERPEGPFRYIRDILPPFSIDPHMVRNGSGMYLFYCNNDYEAERPGTFIQCDKMKDPYTPEGSPACIVRPTMDEEIFQRDRFRNGQHWHTLEGAFYFNVGETHFVMYSGACYLNSTYFIGYCVAHGAPDSDLRKLDWKKYPGPDVYAPVLKKNPYAEGMGHNSVIFENGKFYIVYHARDYGTAGGSADTRSARIDVLRVDGDRLTAEVTP